MDSGMEGNPTITSPLHLNRPRPEDVKNICISVDACAELGGQPYVVLDKLKKLYDITGTRNLTYIDTQQGFHEKSNCTSPRFLSRMRTRQTTYGSFVDRNAAWCQIITTQRCQTFRNSLIETTLPRIVLPLVDAAEEMEREIRKHAFDIMKQRGQDNVGGKPVTSPEDVSIKLTCSDAHNIVFDNSIISEAADRALPHWKQCIDKVDCLNSQNNKKYHKGFMAEVIYASHSLKAYAYALNREFSPDAVTGLQNAPEVTPEQYSSIDWLRNNAHQFAGITLPRDKEWWSRSECIQALRLTDLWPWTLKGKLTEDTKELLNAMHKNTADMAYLDLFANVMPERFPPQNTLFAVVTHDGPLITQMLECATGVHKLNGGEKDKALKQRGKQYCLSTIHEELGLTKRSPDEYPRQAGWVGSEFVDFLYRESLRAIGPFLDKPEYESVLEVLAQFSAARPEEKVDVYGVLKAKIDRLPDSEQERKNALKELLKETRNLELQVRQDIQQMGQVQREGRYAKRYGAHMGARKSLSLE